MQRVSTCRPPRSGRPSQTGAIGSSARRSRPAAEVRADRMAFALGFAAVSAPPGAAVLGRATRTQLVSRWTRAAFGGRHALFLRRAGDRKCCLEGPSGPSSVQRLGGAGRAHILKAWVLSAMRVSHWGIRLGVRPGRAANSAKHCALKPCLDHSSTATRLSRAYSQGLSAPDALLTSPEETVVETHQWR
jgi:hypothetical protein